MTKEILDAGRELESVCQSSSIPSILRLLEDCDRSGSA